MLNIKWTCSYVQPNEEANGQPQMMWSVDKQISKDLKSSSVIKTAWTIWQFILQTAKINCHWTKSLWNASMCSPTKKANGQPRMMWSVDKQTLKELTLNDMKVTGRSSVFLRHFFLYVVLRIIIQFDLLWEPLAQFCPSINVFAQ